MKNTRRFAAILVAFSPALLAQGPATPPPEPGDGPHPHVLVRLHHPMEDVAFLGLATGPISPVLSDQLGLPKGEGLAVVEVVKDGPAKDLLKVHDVIVKLDDQILIDPHQFSVLVRNHKVGDEVTVGYVRGGKASEVKVKLGTHAVPAIGLEGELGGPPHVRELRRLAGPGQDGALDDMGPPPPGEDPAGGPHIRIERRTIQDDGDPEMADALHAVKWDVANGNLVFSDDNGSLALDIKDGKKTLVAKDAKGTVLFSGPVDTKEQVAAMAPALQGRFHQLEQSIHEGHLERHGDMPPMRMELRREDGGGAPHPDSAVE
jgi:hypothetical protein